MVEENMVKRTLSLLVTDLAFLESAGEPDIEEVSELTLREPDSAQ